MWRKASTNLLHTARYQGWWMSPMLCDGVGLLPLVLDPRVIPARAGFSFQGWLLSVLITLFGHNKWSGPFPYCCPTLASSHQPWLHHCWFVVSLHPYTNIACTNVSWRLTHPLRIRHQWQHAHFITHYQWCSSSLIANSVEKIGTSLPLHSIMH